MNLLKVFLLTSVLGGAGGALGSVIGHAVRPGGVFAGGFLFGAALVIAGVFFAERRRWTSREQRPWAILGGVFGFALAAMVTLSTLSSPVGPVLSTLLIGSGAALGARVGRSAHEKS